MRKIILFMHLSLDGFTAGPKQEMDWITVDDEIFNDVLDLQRTADTALFGGVLFREMADYWPSVAVNPSSSKGELEHAHWLNHSPKIVFSKTLQKADWNNSKIVRDEIPAEIQKLKAESGRDILLFGGAEFARALMRLGLIDEYRINVNPVVLGGGKPLFKDAGEMTHLKLLEARTFSSGVVGLRYQSVM